MTSKVDIANDVQKGIEKANRSDDDKARDTTEAHRATRFDGNPDPAPDSKPGVFKPRDDTPWHLEKKSGPRNP
ncbi:hypothetical protein FOZ76_13930 [Verticiella sediminum]|uniref:Uncharacterized protein n=1 Tax=Verticiella sediminum TaxID=1247510 RepID=A0A556AKD5_9BURK|nr:hypothetical protein [Verticiella sediminum]TSH93362.1 hypothetical protein FOZ76_13930 [Verticiella sediminum]